MKETSPASVIAVATLSGFLEEAFAEINDRVLDRVRDLHEIDFVE